MARLFALGRMVEVLLANLHRLHDLWAIFLEHIVEALGDSRPGIRAASLEALSKAIGGALASVVATPAHRRHSTSTPGKPAKYPRDVCFPKACSKPVTGGSCRGGQARRSVLALHGGSHTRKRTTGRALNGCRPSPAFRGLAAAGGGSDQGGRCRAHAAGCPGGAVQRRGRERRASGPAPHHAAGASTAW